MGEGVGEDEVRWRARTQVERLVDEFLPRVSEALVLPEEISLGSRVPEAKLLLRFHAPPRFVDGRGLVVRIDVMVESAAGGLFRDDKTGPQNATVKLPGPLAFPDSDQLFEGSESGVTASPAFVAALADAYAVGGGAERDLGQLSWENGRARRVGPLEIRGTHLAAPSLLTAGGPPGALAWAIPDLALATNLPHDVRVFATGSLTAHLAADGRSVLARPAIQQLYASCRERSGTGWTFLPCLSDATSAFPDAPARLTRALPEITLFADVLGPLADAPLRSGTGLSVSIRPTRVELGDRAGAPRAALAASVSFAVP